MKRLGKAAIDKNAYLCTRDVGGVGGGARGGG